LKFEVRAFLYLVTTTLSQCGKQNCHKGNIHIEITKINLIY